MIGDGPVPISQDFSPKGHRKLAANENDLTNLRQLRIYADSVNKSIDDAVAAEASERERQDSALSESVSTKLEASNILSGEGIEVTSGSKNVTISGTLASQSAPGMMSTADKAKLDGMESSISSAVSAEASERESADDALGSRIDGKLSPTDIKAGSNVAVEVSGNAVTVSAKQPDVSGFVTKTDADASYAPKTHTHTGQQVTGMTPGMVAVSTVDGTLAASDVPSGKLEYISGLESDAQAQIDSKLDSDANAVSATRLETARRINGTAFDGTTDITTGSWGASRGMTVGSTKKTVNGSADVSWSLDEIGAAAKSHTHQASDIVSGTLSPDRLPTITDSKIQSVSASKLSGVIPSANLPGYVDDVVEYAGESSFPDTGEAGKIYVDTDTNKTYRWGGSSYVEISPSIALGTTSSTAFRGDYGQVAYTHAQAKGSAFQSGLYKITTNDQGHVTAATAVTKSDITALGIPGQDTNTTYSLATTGADGLMRALDGSTSHYMRGDGTWGTPPNTTYGNATTSSSGLMSAADKAKLDGIASGANAYSLPTASGTTLGGVKTGANITNSSGTISVTKANVVAALGYTPPTQDTNTTYSAGAGLSLSGTTFSLGDSGVTAGTYGPTQDVNGSNGAKLVVPEITVDSHGRVTSVTSRTYTSVDTNTTYSLSSFGITATAAELNYTDGVTSNIQTQLNGKAASTHNHSASQITSGTLSSDRLPTVPISKGGTGATSAAAAATAIIRRGTGTSDFNNLTTNGVYYIESPENIKNAPAGMTNWGILHVLDADQRKAQVYISDTGPRMFFRSLMSTGSWTEWAEVYSSLHKPTPSDIGAAASSHTHPASQITGLTAGRAVVSDSNGHPTVSSVTSTEVGYLDGVTSNIQTQLNGKLSTSGTAAAATKLATSRTISLSGNVTGSASFDGTNNATISATIANGAVTTARIADKAVTPAKMASDPVYIVNSASDSTSISGKTVVKPCILVVTGGDVPQIVYAS